MKTEQMNLLNTNKCAVSYRTKGWHSIEWRKAERAVRKFQVRITKAEKNGKQGKVRALQRLLTCSFYAKALAVKRTTENKGRKTAGVDGQTWSTPKDKWEAIHDMKRAKYQPLPLKRVYIPKSNGKLRPLSIPTMSDRAKQALHLFALTPIAETKADLNSYGFRMGRSCADAISQTHLILSRGFSPQWILDADIKGCFDNISHEWLLENIPMDKRILRKWLKSGYIFEKQYYPTQMGSPQGGIASPTICNMVLDGLENRVRNCSLMKNHGYGRYTSVDQINFVRYCDDFIITANSKEILEQKVKPAVEAFLQKEGLSFRKKKLVLSILMKGLIF